MQVVKPVAVYTNNEFTPEMVISLFDEKAETWSTKYSLALRNRLNAFKSVLSSYANTHKSLVDVGCGTGIMLRMAYKLGYDVKGIDISPKMVACCKKESKELIPDLVVKCYSFIENYRDFSGTDAIICSSVYEYLENPELYLDLFFKILNKNGIVLLTVPNTKTVTRVFEKGLKTLVKTFPVVTSFHPRIARFTKYLFTSKNRDSVKKLQKTFAKHKFDVVTKMFINTNSSNYSNNYIDSNLILFVLKKVS